MWKICLELRKYQQYDYFKKLVDGIRSFEKLINRFQNELRKKIFDMEFNTYLDIGKEKLERFYTKYDQAFKDLQDEQSLKEANLSNAHQDQQLKLINFQKNAINLIKIKPKKKLKEFQDSEQLVAAAERIEEAKNFRRELNDFEIQEKIRVEKLQMEKNQREKRDLEKKQKFERDLQKEKLKTAENKLRRTMTREYDLLNKQIHLHEKDIQRIHSQITNRNNEKGLQEGESKRFKFQIQLQNQLLKQSKMNQNDIQNNIVNQKELNPGQEIIRQSILASRTSQRPLTAQDLKKQSTKKFSMMSSTAYLFSAPEPLRECIKELKDFRDSQNVIHFYIKNKYGDDKPINVQEVVQSKESGDQHQKVQNFLKEKKVSKKDKIPNLTELYNKNLNREEADLVTTEVSELSKKKRMDFVMEKMQIN